jgi:hypothetical protein
VARPRGSPAGLSDGRHDAPAEAFLGFAVQVRVAPAGVVMVRVIDAVLVVTVLPPASCTVTTGCVARRQQERQLPSEIALLS